MQSIREQGGKSNTRVFQHDGKMKLKLGSDQGVNPLIKFCLVLELCSVFDQIRSYLNLKRQELTLVPASE